jgi:hypothetical protein
MGMTSHIFIDGENSLVSSGDIERRKAKREIKEQNILYELRDDSRISTGCFAKKVENTVLEELPLKASNDSARMNISFSLFTRLTVSAAVNITSNT